MSIHVYFQPIDVVQIQGCVFDYVRGKGTLDELRPELIRITTVGRGCGPWSSTVSDAYWHDRKKLPDWYNNDVVLLERPYFIVENLPARVVELVDQYHNAPTPEAVQAVAESQMAYLNPKGWKKWKTKPRISTAWKSRWIRPGHSRLARFTSWRKRKTEKEAGAGICQRRAETQRKTSAGLGSDGLLR